MSNQVSSDEQALAVFPGALGDLVCFLPALKVLARRALVLLLCRHDLARLVDASTLAAAVPLEGREASWLFSSAPPAEAEEFFRRFAAVDCFSGFGVPEVEANLRRWQGSRGRVHPFRPSQPMHLAAHFLRCVTAEEPPHRLPEARLELRAEVVESARLRLARRVNREGPLLVVHPGSGGQTKRWSRDGFLAVAERWLRRRGRVAVVLGPAERGEERAWQGDGVDVLADLELVDLAVLLGGSAAYLGNDSGPSHLAGAVGASGVALFGPTDRERWRPLSAGIEALRVEPWSAYGERAPSSAIDAVDQALARTASAVQPAEPLLDKVGTRH